MGLTAKTPRTFSMTLLMIWVVVGFVLDGLQASPVRDHSSISQRSEVQHSLNNRIMTRRDTSLLNDDSLKSPSDNIRGDIRPDSGTSISSRTLSLISTDRNKRRLQLTQEHNNIGFKTSRNQESTQTNKAKTSPDFIKDDFLLYPLDENDYDYYYNIDEAILMAEKLTPDVNTEPTSKNSATVTTPVPTERTQTTSSKSASTVSLLSRNTDIGTTQSVITTSTTEEPIMESSTDITTTASTLSTQRSVTSSIHVSTSPVVSDMPFKTTSITPRSFRYTTLKPSLKREPSNLLLNRIRDLILSSDRPITEATTKGKTLKVDHFTEPLQTYLLSDTLVVEISSAPKVTSQRQSRQHNPSQTVSRTASSTSTSSRSGSASSNSTTPKPSTTTIPVISTSTVSSTNLVPDTISERNVEAQRKSESHSVSTSAVRLEVHATAESAPVEIFENLPSQSNDSTSSPSIQLQKQHGESPLGVLPFGENPRGSMPFGVAPLGQQPFGLNPQGLPLKANVTKATTATTPQTTPTTPTLQSTTVEISPATNPTVTTSKPDALPLTFEKGSENEKVGYVVAEENQSRFQLEQVTKDGFIIGEFGTVNHSNGDVNGVRYTADGSVDHKLIHEALQRFLSL